MSYKKSGGPLHEAGKDRLYNLFKRLGYEVYKEVPTHETLEDGDKKGYVFDVLVCGRFADTPNKKIYVILEVDTPHKGHGTKDQDIKAAKRDGHFLWKYGIPTARFETPLLRDPKKYGRRMYDDDVIIKQVEWMISENIEEVRNQNKLIYSRKSKCCKCGDYSESHTFSGCMVCNCQWGYIHSLD